MSTLDDFRERACRVCGCTWSRACVSRRHGPCWWVEYDLCSHCAMKGERLHAVLVVAAGVVATLLFGLAVYVGMRLG